MEEFIESNFSYAADMAGTSVAIHNNGESDKVIKVLIADDHPVVREGLMHILSRDANIEVVCAASNGQEVLDFVRENEVDVLVLDMVMPLMSGIQVLEHLRQESVRLPVLILSVHPEEEYALRMLKAGAAGYLNKISAAADMVNIVKLIASGHKYISPEAADMVVQELEMPDKAPRYENLSKREHEIMCMIALGKSLKDIAGELNINIKTVSTYRARILEKLKLESNAALVLFAYKNHLI
ncbi:MAG: response regulator transcription factor [Nitrospirae bacterium]|nr:response regulator transcription factor [Nitrospirota bacterium]